VVNLTKDAVDLGAGMLTLTTTKANVCAGSHQRRAGGGSAADDGAFPRPVCVHEHSGEPYTCDGVRTLFRRAVAKAEIEDFHFHDCATRPATRLRQQDGAEWWDVLDNHADDGPAVCPLGADHDAKPPWTGYRR